MVLFSKFSLFTSIFFLTFLGRGRMGSELEDVSYTPFVKRSILRVAPCIRMTTLIKKYITEIKSEHVLSQNLHVIIFL